jgi:arabinogalactan endo-1,4-beta-galactosidase
MMLTASCTNSVQDVKTLVISKITCQVGEKVEIKVRNLQDGETVTFSTQSDSIYIENGYVEGMLAGQTVTVNATSSKGGMGSFTVTVEEDNYSSYRTEESTEGWFDPVSIDKIQNLRQDFPMGIDISTLYEVESFGGKFYNQNGVRQNVYQILKNSGINYVRIRLWNDPYNTFIKNGETVRVPYGGGICDFDRVKSMARSAKIAGLKVLLDFHYSDFWAHPGQQVIPKAWKDLATPQDIADELYDYTFNIIKELDLAGAKPDMVQIGNEITSGMILQYSSGTNQILTGDNPYYISERSSLKSAIRGAYSGSSTNFIGYVRSGNNAVKDYDSKILTMIHLAKGMSGTDYIKDFYHLFDDVNYDVIGLSYYPYYHGSISNLNNAVSMLSQEFSDKLITIVEISYGFTFAPHANANNIFFNTTQSGNARPVYGYEVSPQGQADLLRDSINALSSVSQGYGIFYWEGCWIPVAGVGWADSNSKNSWANQALFSYDGKALPSLEVFKLIR